MICDIGSKADVKHTVHMTNLMTYPADVLCKGFITARPNVVRFSSPLATDSATTWTARKPNLVYGLPQTFSHVGIISNGHSSSGAREVIDLVVQVNWRQPAKLRSMTLSIEVTA